MPSNLRRQESAVKPVREIQLPLLSPCTPLILAESNAEDMLL
jgi:hypothetical protein